MKARIGHGNPPKGFARLAFRAPIWIYRAHLGRLMGTRVLMLEHLGRKSGLLRRVVLEVVSNRPDAAFVAAGWPSSSDWLKNIRADPRVVVHLGSRTFATEASEVDETLAREVFDDYAGRHPKAFTWLVSMLFDEPGLTASTKVEQVTRHIPLVRLQKPS